MTNTPKEPSREPTPCPRCKSVKTKVLKLQLHYLEGHRECEWCGLHFLVDEQGEVIPDD